MAQLSLKIVEGCEEPYIEFWVDGNNFGTQIKAAFGEHGFDDVLPWYGGDYSLAETVLHLEGVEQGEKQAILFACGCGYAMCSSVWVSRQVDAATVRWCRFSTWRHGKEIIAPIESATFDRRQFEDALCELKSAVEFWERQHRSH